ncbi:hypothetical protein F2Q68_00035706 [Brassica cretica]|uniref:Uncharacterized protein n=1 Tax=Brassica cretica TaxID=69181 RepID=A0A8S9GWX8_BRACR|nr:hypothetical protein F2Q68_00035706 [Brassica cretica]
MNIGQVRRVRRGVEAAGSPTRVAKLGRDGDVGLTRGRARGIVYTHTRRDSCIDSLTRGEGCGESYPRARRQTASTV